MVGLFEKILRNFLHLTQVTFEKTPIYINRFPSTILKYVLIRVDYLTSEQTQNAPTSVSRCTYALSPADAAAYGD